MIFLTLNFSLLNEIIGEKKNRHSFRENVEKLFIALADKIEHCFLLCYLLFIVEISFEWLK
jgi:hypothetical protein